MARPPPLLCVQYILTTPQTTSPQIERGQAQKPDPLNRLAPQDGQMWGLAHRGRFIPAKGNLALIYQGKPGEQYRHLGFRENAVAGGILQAMLQFGD